MKRRIRGMLAGLLACLFLPVTGGAEFAVSLTGPDAPLNPWGQALIRFTVGTDETVDLTLKDDAGAEIFTVVKGFRATAGQNSLYWNGTYQHEPAPAGTWKLVLDAPEGGAETPITIGEPIPKGAETAQETAVPGLPEETAAQEEAARKQKSANETAVRGQGFTPASTSPWAGKDGALNYWTMEMDITREAEIWQVLTAPITVVDNGKGEKAQIILRSEPDAKSRGVGSVTCATQGVHVLERGEEWSLVECYSSSFHDSPVLNWNALVQGYVPTRYLEEITPNQKMGMVVDKLTQRLYIFVEGHLFSTLLVSTGLSNARQPYNETRSGEFLLTSKVGTFASDNMKCPLAIRFNKGDLLHEVPYVLTESGQKIYGGTESRLGSKASHGCIRVQRKKTPEGVDMGWIWNALRNNSKTRLLIWEDWQGRQIGVPEDDTLLYYRPGKDQVYHSEETCASLRAGTKLRSFAYGELDTEPYAKLKRCEYCAPPRRRAEIETFNAAYALGEDHNPVLTKALESCPRSLR